MSNSQPSSSYGPIEPFQSIRFSSLSPYAKLAALSILGLVCFGVVSNINMHSNREPIINAESMQLEQKQQQYRFRSPFLRRSPKFYAHFGGASHEGYFTPSNVFIDPNSFHFAMVTDLDKLSRVPDANKLTFQSLILPAVLNRDPSINRYSFTLGEPRMLYSQHNEGGRGMELSELTLYQNRLLAFDDRTGIVFELLNRDQGKSSIVVPRLVITEGYGDSDKGMKWEWAALKDNNLYLGSIGKEYNNPDGTIKNYASLWISIISPSGEIRRVDWTNQYNFVREQIGASLPGYWVTEAVLWSSHLQKWLFLPRRISFEKYNDVKDEIKGANKLVVVDEYFKQVKVIDIKFAVSDPLRGFSSFAFVPNTQDRHALALRSVEEDCAGDDESKCKQRSYLSVFDVMTGDVLMEETQINLGDENIQNIKFEGVEFVNLHTPEPY